MTYQATLSGLSPTGHWHLNDTSGTTAAAAAGSAGTYGNNTYGTTEQQTVSYQQGSILPDTGGNSIKLGGWVSGTSYDDDPMATTSRVKLPVSLSTNSDWSVCFVFEQPNTASAVYSTTRSMLSIHESGAPEGSANFDKIAQLNPVTGQYRLWGVNTSPGFAEGTSHQVIATYDDSVPELKVWLDGTLIATEAPNINQAYDYIYIGTDSNSGLATKYAEIAYWNSLLTPAQVTDLFNAFSGSSGISNSIIFDYYLRASDINNQFIADFSNDGAPAPSGTYESFVASLAPRRWYKCDEYAEGTLPDYGSDGVSAGISVERPIGPRLAQGSPEGGGSVSTAGGDRVLVGSLFDTNTYTVSFWAYGWINAASAYLFSASDEAVNGLGAQVYVEDGNQLQFFYTFWDSPHALTDSAPIMVTVRSTGSQVELYLNGQPLSVTPVSTNRTLLTARFGCSYSTTPNYSQAYFDEILIFDYVLSDAQIADLYNQSANLVEAAGVTMSVQGSQTSSVPSINTPPANYCLSIQGSRREHIAAQKTGSNNLHYFATAGLTTTPTSTPAGEVIPPTLRNPGNLYREINLNEFGIVKPSFGEIVIDNLGGVHDDLLTKKLDGQKATLYRGKRGAEFPGGFTQVLKSSIAGISADYNQIRLKLRDDLDFLDTPLLTKTFSGEGGIKGDSSVTGQPRSRHFLMSTYAPARLIDQSKLIYHISDNNAFDAYSAGLGSYWEDKTWFAYDGGVEIDRAGDYSTIYELENLSPDPGECRFYINQEGGVYLRLGSPPAFDVRVKPYPVTGGGVGIDVPSQTYNISDIVNEVVPGNGVFGFIAQERIVTDNSETVAEFISDQARAFFYNVWTDRLGAIKVQRFNAFPETGSAVKTFSANEIINIQIANQIPAYKLIINSGETFPSSLATGAPAAVKDALSKTGYVKQIVSEDVTVKSSHKLSKPLQIDTKTYINASDESSIIYSYKTFFRERQYVQLDVVVNDETLALDINNIVMIQMPRLGFNTGKNFTITGVRHDFALNRLVLTLWG